MRRSRVVPALTAVLLVGALAGCTAAGTASGSSAAGGRAPMPAAAADSSAVHGQAAGASAAKAPAVDRSVVTTGSLQLVTDHPIPVAQRIADLVTGAGGSVGRSDEVPGGRASASLELRIPSDAFQRTLDTIRKQGDVRDLSIRSTDVTARVTDYTVRIANLRTSIGRLQQLLAKATSSSALVEIESALTDREGSLEQLLAEQKTLNDQVAYSTLSVSIVVPAAAPKAGPADFIGGLVAGTRSLVETLAAIAVGLGVALPWLVLLGALGAFAALAARAVRRRTRATSA